MTTNTDAATILRDALTELTRYEESSMEGGGVYQDANGGYVKLADVESALAAAERAAIQPAGEAVRWSQQEAEFLFERCNMLDGIVSKFHAALGHLDNPTHEVCFERIRVLAAPIPQEAKAEQGAVQLNEGSSMPVDMTQAKRWIVQLRARIDTLLGIINSTPVAPEGDSEAGEPAVVTFDQFVQYGRDNGANIVNGIPWSFSFSGCAVSHETDRMYLISANGKTMYFEPEHIILQYPDGRIEVSTIAYEMQRLPAIAALARQAAPSSVTITETECEEAISNAVRREQFDSDEDYTAACSSATSAPTAPATGCIGDDAKFVALLDNYAQNGTDGYLLCLARIAAYVNRWADARSPVAAAPEAVHQFRKWGSADWYDGHADHEDGGGPYEARTLYTAPTASTPPAPAKADNPRPFTPADFKARPSPVGLKKVAAKINAQIDQQIVECEKSRFREKDRRTSDQQHGEERRAGVDRRHSKTRG